MKINKLILPFKREVWEHQGSFFGVFLALGGLLLVLAIFGIVQVGLNAEDINIQITAENFEYDSFEDDDFQAGVNKVVHASLHNLIGSIMYVFVMISGFVTFFYMLGALFDDRKDRSVLFWKSMPVSEFQVVLTKFVTGLFTIPIIAMVIGLITACVLSVIVSAWLPSISDYSFFQALGKLRFLESLALVLIFIFASSAWLAPFGAWIMLASAFARKSPVTWCLAPPVLLVLSEQLLLGRSFFLRLMQSYLPDLALLEQADDDMSFASMMALVKPVFTGPEIYIGMLVSAVFLAACVWLRNNRYEI